MLRLWEGLGYYRRARQLHRAAEIIVAEHGGRFPRDPPVVRRLPGIGRYTAGAILSIAFDAPEPILEANTLRLWCRLLDFGGDPRSAEGQRLLWAAAAAVLPRHGAGRMNQALMELGGQVCTPRAPHCEVCPAASLCRANREGRQAEIPRPRVKQQIEALREAAVLVRRRGRVLLVRWPEGRRWAGLWDFPRFPLRAGSPAAVRRELAENVRALTGVRIAAGRPRSRAAAFRDTVPDHAGVLSGGVPLPRSNRLAGDRDPLAAARGTRRLPVEQHRAEAERIDPAHVDAVSCRIVLAGFPIPA